MNPQPVGDVWLAYQPPADPGTVVFVSNTTPPYPLLTLRIDAMCGSCINNYSIFGSVSVPENTVTDGAWLDIVPLENDFGLGVRCLGAFPKTAFPFTYPGLAHALIVASRP